MMNNKNNYMTEKMQLAFFIILLGFVVISQAQLNDTGQIACANELTVQLPCNDVTVGTSAYLGQDAEQGLDAVLFNPDDGLGGFSFTKLDSNGLALSDQQVEYEVTPWSCVQDNVTGLMWEVKTDEDGLQDRDWTYSWYNSTGINDGGFAGIENSGSCVDSINCDTEKFISAINTENLCGFDDWRLPNPSELLSIVTFNPIPFADLTFPIPPAIDVGYFPQTLRADYWTSYSAAINPGSAQVIYFGGNNGTEPKSFERSIRAVREQLGEPL